MASNQFPLIYYCLLCLAPLFYSFGFAELQHNNIPKTLGVGINLGGGAGASVTAHINLDRVFQVKFSYGYDMDWVFSKPKEMDMGSGDSIPLKSYRRLHSLNFRIYFINDLYLALGYNMVEVFVPVRYGNQTKDIQFARTYKIVNSEYPFKIGKEFGRYDTITRYLEMGFLVPEHPGKRLVVSLGNLKGIYRYGKKNFTVAIGFVLNVL